MDLKEEALALHKEKGGKLEMRSKVRIENQHDLALAYTPGVAYACKEIEKDPSLSCLRSWQYRSRCSHPCYGRQIYPVKRISWC